MKIGLIIYGSINSLSGGYMYDRRLVEYLREQGDTVEIISLPWRNYAAHLADNLSFKLPKGYDILIQDELNHPSLISANRANHPYPVISLVHHLRCSEFRPAWQNAVYQFFERQYLESVDGFIFNSKTTAGVVASLIGGSRPSIVAYPPTDRFGEALPEAEITARAISEPLKILFLGNIIERKGLMTLLQALPPIKSKVSLDVIGSLVSDPEYVRQVQSFIKAKNLSSIVHLHGPLDNAPLEQKLRQAHLLAVPSSYEGFGIVYLEGMGFGLPAVGTTSGAAAEIIEDERTGFLINHKDHQTLSSHISRIAVDRNLLNKLSLNARERYLHQPRWHEIAGQIRAFLQSML